MEALTKADHLKNFAQTSSWHVLMQPVVALLTLLGTWINKASAYIALPI